MGTTKSLEQIRRDALLALNHRLGWGMFMPRPELYSPAAIAKRKARRKRQRQGRRIARSAR